MTDKQIQELIKWVESNRPAIVEKMAKWADCFVKAEKESLSNGKD